MRCFVDNKPCTCDMAKLDDCTRDPIRIAEEHAEEYETIRRLQRFAGDENEAFTSNS